MAETLRQKQSRFVRMVARLLLHADILGYEVTFGDAWAHAEDGRHVKNSNHYIRLAIDLNLFSNGRYLRSTEAHRPLGEYWESIGGTWGGSKNRSDGNHYSLEHNGMW